MKRIVISLSMILCLTVTQCMAQTKQNTLSEEEQDDGWELLFDGASPDDWRGYQKDGFPEQGWKVEDGMLMVLAGGGGGDIITRETYGDFILKLEWKAEKGGNSGIFYRALEQPTQAIYWSAPEFQILDNENHPDATRGEDGNRKAGSLYDLIPAKPQNANPYGEWNSAKIVANGSKIEHWQNGEKVLEYELWTPKWYEMLRNSKFVDHPEFGDMHEGHIGLQDHGNTIQFRNIKIKKLD
ncbi:MAG: DUF1080 domain-containing protein [Gracilimonas sp.]|nr:DUF1080 domain-containing protein [Gracilimonas sp.]